MSQQKISSDLSVPNANGNLPKLAIAYYSISCEAVFSKIRCFVCLHQCVYSFMSFQEESNQSVWILSYCLGPDVWLRVDIASFLYTTRANPSTKLKPSFYHDTFAVLVLSAVMSSQLHLVLVLQIPWATQ